MRQTGILDHWNDERGFGFIRTDDGARIFFHVSALIAMARRPQAGDLLSFDMGTGSDGRPAAIAVQPAGPDASSPLESTKQRPRLFGWRLYTSLLLIGLLVLALLLDRAPGWLGVAYGAMGVLSAWLYGSDKVHARAGGWRTREFNLLAVDFTFGIIGVFWRSRFFVTKPESHLMSSALSCSVSCTPFGWRR